MESSSNDFRQTPKILQMKIFDELYFLLSFLLNFTGEEVISHWDIYRSGPYGNVGGRNGEFFNDFRQTLDGKQVRPNHWPDTINIRAGGSIDG